MSDRTSQRPPNRLIQETSPYLLQHAYNPVDWHPWGPEALTKARATNTPILLSIGYSACHWCHVMERESFESNDIATIMNTHFICVKVDREERPDLDEIYMQATLALNHGQGGWPMTVFLTPEQEPIFAGTYFPPADRWGRPGFASLLTKIADAWKRDPTGLRRQAGDVTRQLHQSLRVASSAAVGEAELDTAVNEFAEDFDARYGGFGQAPKFPPATGLSFLLRHHHRTGDPHTLTMVTTTLDAMAAGGMYDHVGGGFARYSTDDRWLVPHFEKMLYDNALLARTYLEACQATGLNRYRRVATEMLDYILKEMTSPEGGFYSATDADSEGVEGKFFVWTPEQIRAAVPNEEDAARFCAYYDITPGGNWEHASIPNTPESLDAVATRLHITPNELQMTLERVKPLVYAARAKRVPPGLDDKILTAWNGMMISALAEGARVLGDSRYLETAEEAAEFLLRTMQRPDGGLYRTYRAGKAHLDGCLEDYAWLAEGLIDLYEAGAHEGYLKEAVRLAERILVDFVDAQQGGFFTTSKDHESLILRSREGPDGATPSGNAVAASVLARLSFHFSREDFRDEAARAVRAYGRQMTRYPRAFAKSLSVIDLLLRGPVELAFIGSPAESRYEALRAEANRWYLPLRIIAHHDPQGPEPEHPLTAGKSLVNSTPALYVCRNFSCQAPLTDPATVGAALRAQHTRQQESPSTSLSDSRLVGAATPDGTAGYAARMIARQDSDLARGFTPFGSTGLTVCRLGFGGYRTETDDADHRQALLDALRQGCNLIDTSTNYLDGDSERLIGSVLAELTRAGELKRNEVIIVSKIGYVQGQNLKTAEAREQAGTPYPEMVKYGDGIWHCLHPEFLADQLDLSLDRLGLQTLDGLLLHNAEYFLSDAAHRGRKDLPALRQEFYRRLHAAFAWLETQVAAGRIRWYGVSSNTATADSNDPEATSLSSMIEAARMAATNAPHHFRVVQCPMNLFESGALLTPNTGAHSKQTLLDLAREEQLAVLLNRPLNAMASNEAGMIRLADMPVEAAGVAFEAQCTAVAAIEADYRRDFAPHVPWSGQGLSPHDYFRWADELTRIRPHVQGLEHWDQIENQMIAPQLHQILRALTNLFKQTRAEPWQQWQARYLPQLLLLLKTLRHDAGMKSRETTASIAKKLAPFLPPTRLGESLSRKALWVLVSTPGVTCVLNGMRTPAYVKDSLAVLRWEPLSDARRVYEALRSASPGS
ncbi:MAG: DUF255 domain-containing protein [Nitrospira sp.]|nr:DUF255 domain-containing protein [Nitrospira sp.]